MRIKPPFYWAELFKQAPGLMTSHLASMSRFHVEQFAAAGTWGTINGIYWVQTGE